MNSTKEIQVEPNTIQKLHCSRCGYSWFPRKPTPPKNCPDCNSPYWNKARVRKRKTVKSSNL